MGTGASRLTEPGREAGDAGTDVVYGRGLLDIAKAFQPVGATSSPQASGAAVKIGSCTLGLDGAKQAGLDGVQVWAGNAADELDIELDQRLADQLRVAVARHHGGERMRG